ncbi:MAG: hypothetical protein K6G55_02750 [Selenomonadaceae bacterium]|nr:hypothetical protein [Selenomonadaceae bacterium]
MIIEAPTPPTPPSLTGRPTPPTPPRIDKTPFLKDSADKSNETADENIIDNNVGNDKVNDTPQVNRKVEDPESMARDAVANGSGTLTKRTVSDNEQDNQQPQQIAPTPRQEPQMPIQSQSDYDRGKDVLRQFENLDEEDSQPIAISPRETFSEKPVPISSNVNTQGNYGAAYWIFMIILMGVAAFIIVKKFLLTDKPQMTAATLFDGTTERLRAASERVKNIGKTPEAVNTSAQDDKVNSSIDVVKKSVQNSAAVRSYTGNNKIKITTEPEKKSEPVRKISREEKIRAAAELIDSTAKTSEPVKKPAQVPKSKTTTEQIKPSSPSSSVRNPSKDDKKGNHFEIRV